MSFFVRLTFNKSCFLTIRRTFNVSVLLLMTAAAISEYDNMESQCAIIVMPSKNLDNFTQVGKNSGKLVL